LAHDQSAEEPPHNPSLLIACLDSHPDRAQERYLELYQKLLRLFEWRGCYHPEEAADQTLDRVNKKLEQGIVVSNIHAYIGGVARLVCFEFLRAQERFVPILDEHQVASQLPHEEEGLEQALVCLDQCVMNLSPLNGTLIRRYYESRDRAGLSKELGMNLNALRLRASRIREKLERCILTCLRSSEA
jgi:DNA-directed RNA polymerase specialized sigma24 family protein